MRRGIRNDPGDAGAMVVTMNQISHVAWLGLLAACGNAATKPPAAAGSGEQVARADGSGSPGSGSPGSGSAPPRPGPGGCPEASFVKLADAAVHVYDIATSCAVSLRATWTTPMHPDAGGEPLRPLSAAWPRRDGPLFVAVADGEHDEHAAIHVLRYDQPRALGGAAPVAMDAPGIGDDEPEGYTFAVVADDRGAYVERCAQWGVPCDDCEEVEEWPCQEHLYFPIAGGKAVKGGVTGDRFATPLVGDAVAGSLSLRRKGSTIQCTTPDGVVEDIDLGVQRRADYLLAPIDDDSFFLGEIQPGGRSHGERHVWYERYDRCVSRDSGRVVPGPGGLWATATADPYDPYGRTQPWTIYLGDLPLSAPALLGGTVVWTR
jgi:hypothetical protein